MKDVLSHNYHHREHGTLAACSCDLPQVDETSFCEEEDMAS